LSLHDKDVRIAASMAMSEKMSVPVLALVAQMFAAASKNLGTEADYIEVIKYAAKMNGEEW
ncbi:MAG TPA: NAD-binding protein, partial [Thermoanaerobaculia bacterium]|nr:NAD-binding protein [Thermoanaerobaculia bacterium]